MPPAAYGAPAIRAANSSPRSPAKTRCVWLSTKPGMTQRPPASMRVAPAPPPAATATTRSSSNTSAASRDGLAELRVVRDEQADVVDHRASGSCRERPRAARAATSIDTCAPSRTIQRPPTMTSRRRRRRRRRRPLRARGRCRRGGRGPGRRRRGRRARPARSARRRASRCGVAVGGRRAQQRGGARGGRARRSPAARRARSRAPPRTGR